MRRCTLAVLATVVFSSSPVLASRVAILDAASKSVAIADLRTGAVETSVKLADPPTRLLATPDGKTLVVLSRGAGKLTWIGEFRPTTKGSATILDARSLEVLGRVELGWGEVGDSMISADSRRLWILSPGIEAKAPDGKNAELFAVDLETRKSAGSTPFPRACGGYPDPTGGFAIAPDGKSGVVYFEGYPRAKRPTEMRFVDLETMKAGPLVAIEAKTKAPVGVAGSDVLYLLDPPAFRTGKIYAVSLASKSLAGTFDVGSGALIAAADEQRGLVLVLSQTQGKGVPGANGQLQVLRGAEMIADTKVTDWPVQARFSPDRKAVWIVSEGAAVRVPLDTLEPAPVFKTERFASDLYLPPAGNNAYFFIAKADTYCCAVSTWNLEKQEKVKQVAIGSTGAKVAAALGALAASAASYSSSKSAAKSSGASSFYYTMYTPRIAKAGRGMIHIGDSSVYALDPQTSYVAIIDPASGEKVGLQIPVAGGAQELVPLHDGSLLAVRGLGGVSVISTASGEKSDEWVLEGKDSIVRAIETGEDGLAIVLTNRGVRAIDRDGKLTPLVKGVGDGVDFLFFGGAAQADQP